MSKGKTIVTNHIAEPRSDHIMHAIVTALMIIFLLIIIYPCVFIISSSFSSGRAVSAGKVLLWPVEPSLSGYEFVFHYRAVWIGYANTIFYTVVGTIISMILTLLGAYPLSRRNFQGKKYYLILYMIPMFIGGGLIPKYMLMNNLHLTNTRWAMLLCGSLSIYNTIVMKTFFQSTIPYELFEAAKMDGISDFGYLVKIVLPLSKAVFAVISLYYAVSYWNDYFSAMIYLRDPNLQPLQVVLRNILNCATIDLSQVDDIEAFKDMIGLADLMKYALIVVSTVPMLCLYPFMMKFFKKGVMIGAVKG